MSEGTTYQQPGVSNLPSQTALPHPISYIPYCRATVPPPAVPGPACSIQMACMAGCPGLGAAAPHGDAVLGPASDSEVR